MRFVIALILGGLVDLLVMPVTIPLWEVLIHDPIAATPTYGMRSGDIVLFLTDAVGAVVIVGGIGMIVASAFVHYVAGPRKYQR